MNLRRVFLVFFTIACLPGVAWSGWAAWQAERAWSDAGVAKRTAEAMGLALRLADAFTLERGTLIASALTEDPAFIDRAAIERANDVLLTNAENGLRRAGLPDEAVAKARHLLGTVRARVAGEITRPLAARDPGLPQKLEEQMDTQLQTIRAAVDLAERDAAAANARIGMLIAAGSLGVELRDLAGRRSVVLTRWIGGSMLRTTQVDQAVALTGRLQQTWEQLQRQVSILGNPARLVEARDTIRDGFFREAEPRYKQLIASLHAGEPPMMTVPAYRRWTIAHLGSLAVVRDAAIAEAVKYGKRLESRAVTQLLVAGLAMIGLLCLGALALLVLLNRLVMPVQRLTDVITRLAAGDLTTEVTIPARRDEIAAMASAIEVFRGTAMALRQTNLRFDAALRNMQNGLTMYDADDRLVVINERVCASRGLPHDALKIGMTFREVIAVQAAAGHFGDRTVDEIMEERRGTGAAHGLLTAFEEVQGDRRFEILSHPMQDGGWISTLEDITARKEAERALREANDRLERRVTEAIARHAEAEEALRHSQKMEAVGQLTGGIAHDFNNMLASVSASLEVIQRRIDQGRTMQLDRYIDMAQSATRRATALTHRLLAFSRRQTLDPRPTDVNQLVAGMEEMICRTLGPAIRVEIVSDGALWRTLIDANQLDNALLNLCINARDAMPDGGRLIIETLNCRLDVPALHEKVLLPGDYVALRVTDTGVGMPPEVIARAFDPFFTTKPIGQGTGLGLSMMNILAGNVSVGCA